MAGRSDSLRAVGGVVWVSAPVIPTTTNKDAQDIYRGRVVFFNGTASTGYDWATTASGASPYTLSAFGTYSVMPLSGGSATNNYSTAAGGTEDLVIHQYNIQIGTNSTTPAVTDIGGATALTYDATSNPLGATIGGTTVNLANAPQTFTVGDSSNVSGSANELTISSAIASGGAGGALTKAGAGALKLDGAQGYDILNANAGTTNVNGVLGSAPGLAVVTVAARTTKLKFGTVIGVGPWEAGGRSSRSGGSGPSEW